MPTQSSDIYTPNAPAILYSNNGQSWKVTKGTSVGSFAAYAVRSDYTNTSLINNGYVYSGNNHAIRFYESGAQITNKKKGLIEGNSDGIYIGETTPNNDSSVWNYGKIDGNYNGIYASNVSNLKVYNYKSIYGDQYGIFISINTADNYSSNTIKNYDKLSSQNTAIYINDDYDASTKITNYEDGLISGPNYALYVADGQFKLTNKGKMVGEIHSEAGDMNDKVVNKGKLKSDAYLGGGDDVYKNKDGKAKMVAGEYGNDTLIAGKSKDKFLFNAALSATNNVDTVKNFKSGKDKFYLDDDIFTALTPGSLGSSQFTKGKQAKDADDYIIHHKKSGAVYYDRDGSGVIYQPVQFAQLDKKLKLSYSDIEVVA